MYPFQSVVDYTGETAIEPDLTYEAAEGEVKNNQIEHYAIS